MKQKGFTLIELIVVIVILGILAATALPKFVDFQKDAADGAAAGVAGALASASAINYGASVMGKSSVVVPIISTTQCTSILASLVANSDANIKATGTTSACAGAGTSAECTITHDKGNASGVTAKVVCTG